MAMQITQKSGEGLSRVYGVTVPMQDLADKLEAKIAEILPAPATSRASALARSPPPTSSSMYGKALMGEVDARRR